MNLWNWGKFYKREYYLMRIFQLLLILLLGNCALTENVQKEESKDFIEAEWKQEAIDINYMSDKERLDYFYTQELVDLEYLAEIYPGYVEVGTLNRVSRESLRYTWEEARLLAMREFDFQKEKENWEQYTISERPRLLLEEGSKDFYRYYEYFVIDDVETIQGSILIPTYKRTEELITAGVRRYRKNGMFYEYQEIKYIFPELNEERLDFFYNYEDLNKVQISNIFVDLVNSNPLDVTDYNKLKIDWKTAREQALDEFEYQKDRLGWESHQVSEKPKLVLDENIDRFYRYYEFFVRDGKNIVGSILIPTLYVADSTQTGEVRKYSEYGETQVFEKVMEIQPEFTEERLEYFYEREPIAEQQLSRLYEGEFPEGEKNPKNLRIHWKDARELALAELELQKDIQKWTDVRISDTAILINDEQEAFYRYYEYRVYRGKKVVGAIRIPAYRRTENFATAAVHVYADDEKTYTVHPTGWGNHIINISYISKSSTFFMELDNLITPYLIDNVVFNWGFRIYDQLGVKDQNLIDPKQNYNILKDFYTRNSSSIPNLKNSLSAGQKDSIIENMTRSELTEVNNSIQTLGSLLIKLEVIANGIDGFRLGLKETTLMSYSNFYLEANNYTLSSMVNNNTKKSQLQSSLKNMIWDIIEQNKYSQQQLMDYDWEFGSIFTKSKISPIIQYNNFNLYPKKDVNNIKYDLLSSQYKLLTVEKHEQAMLLSAGLSTDIACIELYNSIQGNGLLVNEKIPENILENALLLKDNTNSRFIFVFINILLMPIKAVLLEVIDSVVNIVVDNITDTIDLPLEKILEIAKGIISILPSDIPQLQEFKNLIALLDIVINNPENVATDILSRMFGSWSVWVIPIFPFPTWVHYVDKWGPVPRWQMIMGWPNFWTLKEFPLPNFDFLKPIPKPPVEIVGVPAGLEEYPSEWAQALNWLQENQVLVVNEDGSFKYGTEQQSTQVVNTVIRLMKNIYIDKIVVDYTTGEIISSPTEEQINRGLEELLNNDGREFIGQLMPNLPKMTEFVYIK